MKTGFVCIDGTYYAPNHPYVKSKSFVTQPFVTNEFVGKPIKKRKTKPTGKRLNSVFAAMLSLSGDPVPSEEFKFHPTRKWRFDYAWPEYKLALEVDGGIWISGRHTRGSGRLGDMEKFNHAAMLGWRILYVTPQQLCTVAIADMIRKAMAI